MIIFSVAMNGSSCAIRRAITLGYTTRPSQTFCSVERTISAVKNASGRVILRFALVVMSACKPQTPDDRGLPIIECPLKPLYTRSHECILMEDHQVPRETAHALGAHRVPLVRHCGRPYLCRLKGLFHFLTDYRQLQSNRIRRIRHHLKVR